MTLLWRIFLRRLLPEIERLEALAPVLDPAPDSEYEARMAQARQARERAERILATMREPKPPRPA